MTGRLAGLTALVTGGSRGIGAAVTRRFAAEGAAVAIAHEPTPEMARLAEALAAELATPAPRPPPSPATSRRRRDRAP